MSLKGTAKQTIQILEQGYFLTTQGEKISLKSELDNAVQNSQLICPVDAIEAFNQVPQIVTAAQHAPVKIEVTCETTQIAARRLVQEEGVNDLVLLNFASARNAGGGFLNGAKAQEEDLCRCSGLYLCLMSQQAYFVQNRLHTSALYTDHMIYSPNVPWFRTRSRDTPDSLFLASVITAPAPNAGVVLRQEGGSISDVERVLRQRAGLVLAVAAKYQHRNVLLGAWGCGVFQNQPKMVADAFGAWLESDHFKGCFDRIVFAVYQRSPERENFTVFQQRFFNAPESVET